MGMRVIVMALLVSSGCANVHVNRGALVASTAALVCDWTQTYRAADRDWIRTFDDGQMKRMWEGNPILGERPGTGAVTAYFAGAVLVNAAAWALMPKKYRAVIPTVVFATQARVIRSNSARDLGVCGN